MNWARGTHRKMAGWSRETGISLVARRNTRAPGTRDQASPYTIYTAEPVKGGTRVFGYGKTLREAWADFRLAFFRGRLLGRI